MVKKGESVESMIAGVGIKIVQIEQKSAVRALRQTVQELRLAHVLLWEVNKVDAVFQQERDRNLLFYQSDSGGYQVQHFPVIRDRDGQARVVIIASGAADLSEGKVVAMPWKFVASLEARDLIQEYGVRAQIFVP